MQIPLQIMQMSIWRAPIRDRGVRILEPWNTYFTNSIWYLIQFAEQFPCSKYSKFSNIQIYE